MTFELVVLILVCVIFVISIVSIKRKFETILLMLHLNDVCVAHLQETVLELQDMIDENSCDAISQDDMEVKINHDV